MIQLEYVAEILDDVGGDITQLSGWPLSNRGVAGP